MDTRHLNPELALPQIRAIPLDRPLVWLWRGWQDLRANPLPSLAYGLLFGLGGDLILLASLSHPHLFTLALSGFFLLAPFLAVGLYELSRARAVDLRLGFVDSLRGTGRNPASLSLFGLALALLTLAWERLSAILFALLGPTDGQDAVGVLLPLLTGLATGGSLALLVFALSVVAIPMLLDRERSDPVAAAVTSLACVARNPLAMLIWGALIVALVLLGFATLLFGLVLFMPLLGHASWHAYKDLVE